ncbi:hypothetical protein FHS18_002070 [Paenibacillus phyllosphaerae]|uniref:Uncharacterized protein n=1 Tax=Paenibacillus phyllosphaerae TaxID=274593 RepID=A0A7W5FME7_9BACL|nr:hypothetical protein [Paenibacillus phyllosphaerae]
MNQTGQEEEQVMVAGSPDAMNHAIMSLLPRMDEV